LINIQINRAYSNHNSIIKSNFNKEASFNKPNCLQYMCNQKDKFSESMHIRDI